MPMKRILPFLLGAVALVPACYDFHLSGPEDPDPLPQPQLVNVTVQYRQPNGCENSEGRCSDRVVFFGSWMHPGAEFFLKADPGSHLWTGVAQGVPVNFPPRDQPYQVRVYDPYLFDAPTGGITAERLSVGGETITRYDRPGSPAESGLVYIDANGFGHSPF